MSKQLWINRDESGTTFVTVAGVRYQVEGTGHSHNQLIKMVNDGDAVVAGEEK